jgi:hypothetical protein
VLRDDVLDGRRELHVRPGKEDQVVADALEVGDDVRREEHGQAAVRDRLHQRLKELAPRERVESRDGLVEDEQLGALRERERERNLGLLPARQRPDLLLERDPQAREPAPREGVVPTRVELAPGPQHLVDPKSAVERMLLRDEADARQEPRRLLARRVAEHAHRASRRRGQADGEMKKRRLAGAVRTDERGDRAGRDGDAAVSKRPLLAIALAEVRRFERRLTHAASSKRAASRVAATSAPIASSSSPALRARSSHRRSAVRSAA